MQRLCSRLLAECESADSSSIFFLFNLTLNRLLSPQTHLPPSAKQCRAPKPPVAMAISSSGSNSIGSFWSDALNCFLFGHGPMTPTLLDGTMITGLDIGSPNPAAHKMAEVPFELSSKANCTNWGTYMNQHIKTKGTVTEKEHTAFLNLWLEHFIFCGPSLA